MYKILHYLLALFNLLHYISTVNKQTERVKMVIVKIFYQGRGEVVKADTINQVKPKVLAALDSSRSPANDI
jgi:hypothetical protein